MILGIASSGGGRRPWHERISMWLGHTVGGAVGGGAAAIAAWLLLTPIRTYVPEVGRAVLVGALLVASVLVDLRIWRLPFKGNQVSPLWVTRFGPVKAFTLYGILLGSGVLTYVPYAVGLSLLGAAGMLTPLLTATALGATFGAARAAVVGPASLNAELMSKVFFRSPASARVFPLASAALTILLAGVVVTASV